MKQEEDSGDHMTRFTEMTTSSAMYTTRRLRLIGQAAREPELMRWSQSIQEARKQLSPAPSAPAARRPAPTHNSAPAPADSIRVLCTKCQTPMRIPFAVLQGKTSLNVRCPKCQNVDTLRPNSASPSPPSTTENQAV
jgi:hypothetical protein